MKTIKLWCLVCLLVLISLCYEIHCYNECDSVGHHPHDHPHGHHSGPHQPDIVGRRKRSGCPYQQQQTQTENQVRRHDKKDACRYTRKTCDPNAPYRTADGSCNNLVTNTIWGMANTPETRFLPAAYPDTHSSPQTRTSSGSCLPLARVVSTKIMQDDTFADFTSHRLTHLMMQWGQFLDHDMVRTATITENDGSEPICCVDDLPAGRTETQATLDAKPECFPMHITTHDRHFSRSCMNFVRSQQTTRIDCLPGPAQQLNLNTHYIDASQVYGSSEKEMANLRNGSTAYLRTSENNLLPHVSDGLYCVKDDPSDFCFKAGDARVNVQPGLMSLHVMFMREHNRIVKVFKQHTQWTDDKIFYETRKIIGAFLQHITYNEFLPVLMGDQFTNLKLKPESSGFSNVYNNSVDPSIRTEFATAAYRYGHSMVQSSFSRKFGTFSNSTLLRYLYGRTKYIAEANGDGLNRIVNGMLLDNPEKADRWYSLEVTDRLFEKSDGDALDLAALNVQRGRDHGLASYNDFRQFCGFTKASSFQAFVDGGLKDHFDVPATRLSHTYTSPDDIDLYPGAISEEAVVGGALGPTFVCLLAKQFQALKEGDRFWYENNDPKIGFTEAQLNSIKRVRLSRIICDNTDITQLVPYAFWHESHARWNRVVPCTHIPSLDLSLWYS